MFTSLYTNWFRGIKKRGGYFLLNLGGLAIGLASFLFITLYVLNELTYDRFHNNYKNIYRIKITGQFAGGELDQAVTAAPMAQAVLKDYPEVLEAARIKQMGDWLIRFGDKKFNESGVLFADSTFFSVLDFGMLKGDPKTALVRPRSMVLTEDFARKYFGDQDPMGQRMNVESDTVFYTVTGVIRNIPDNSHLQFDMLASMSTYPGQANDQFWVSHSFYTYIVVKDGVDKEALETKFQDMVINYVGPQIKQITGQTIEDFRKAGNDFRYVIEPLSDIHLKGATQYNIEAPGSLTTVYIFSVIAILILVIAVINYINLATAKSAARAKEVGVRKVSGAGKPGLILQFLAESLFIVVVAAIVAVCLVYLLMPAFNNITGKHLSMGILGSTAGVLSGVALLLFTGIASGFYPAFVLASFNPVEVLKGTMSPGSMSKKFRGVLVVFQFTVSIIIIIGSIIVYSQLNMMTNKDLGFDKENLIVIKRADTFWRQLETFRTQLLEIPGIEKAGFSRNVPGLPSFNNNAFFNDNDPEKKTYLINQGSVSFDFPEVLGVRLAEGRFFSREYGTDSTAILINEAAVRSLGLKDPVGKFILQPAGPNQFRRLRIIGVMKDFNIESMHKEISPVCFTVDGGGGGDKYAIVRLSGNNLTTAIRAVEDLWEKFTPTMPFQYDFLSDSWDNLYSAEMKTGKIFLIFSGLAIFIACLGLIGLVTYITNKRTREIGIRKSYGASEQVVLALLSKEVIYLILISSLLAYPVAYFGSRYWLEGFASRISVNPMIFILATFITLLIGWLSISYQTIKAANYNPANALRSD
jgi:putative ABC transport system permease protein